MKRFTKVLAVASICLTWGPVYGEPKIGWKSPGVEAAGHELVNHCMEDKKGSRDQCTCFIKMLLHQEPGTVKYIGDSLLKFHGNLQTWENYTPNGQTINEDVRLQDQQTVGILAYTTALHFCGLDGD